MDSETVTVRIRTAHNEFEVSGPPEFVARYGEVIDAMTTRLTNAADSGTTEPGMTSGAPGTPVSGTSQATDFGELLHTLPRSATSADQMLLAGSVAQRASEDNTFSTGEANSLLLEQAVKIGNPSQAMKTNLDGRRVFKSGKSRYRVSRGGLERLEQLTGIGE